MTSSQTTAFFWWKHYTQTFKLRCNRDSQCDVRVPIRWGLSLLLLWQSRWCATEEVTQNESTHKMMAAGKRLMTAICKILINHNRTWVKILYPNFTICCESFAIDIFEVQLTMCYGLTHSPQMSSAKDRSNFQTFHHFLF